MKSLLPCLVGLLLLKTLPASDAGGMCVTLNSDIIFRATEVIPSDRHLMDRYPQVQYSDDDSRRPVGLTWMPKDAETEVASEKIAEVFGKDVWRFVFWQKNGNKNGDGILCVWLGIQATAPSGGLGYRPFLVFNGDDQISDWESYSTYDEKDKFTVKLRMQLKGNGVYWETSTVQLQDHGPMPLRRESGGRRKEVPDVNPYRAANAR